MPIPLPELLSLLQCPRTGQRLTHHDGELISAGGERYPLVDGKPILVRYIKPLHVTPPDQSHVSQNVPSFMLSPEYGPQARALHLGSGNVPCDDPRVVSLDTLPNQNVDVVAEAEMLPFRTGVFDFVASGAVFEHLYDPLAAVREVKRVLKEGGRFYIDTAFMQTYHGFPSHFFNMTPQAVETFIVADFILEASLVPDRATVLHSIFSLTDRFLEHLPEAQQLRLKSMPLGEVLDELRANDFRASHLLQGLSEYAHRAMAASFVVVGRKPVGYDRPRTSEDPPLDAAIRRGYYAARNLVLLRHHEIGLYK